jgi:hypothetical protein
MSARLRPVLKTPQPSCCRGIFRIVAGGPEKMVAWRSSAEYKKAREVADKLAKFRSFTVEGAN